MHLLWRRQHCLSAKFSGMLKVTFGIFFLLKLKILGLLCLFLSSLDALHRRWPHESWARCLVTSFIVFLFQKLFQIFVFSNYFLQAAAGFVKVLSSDTSMIHIACFFCKMSFKNAPVARLSW